MSRWCLRDMENGIRGKEPDSVRDFLVAQRWFSSFGPLDGTGGGTTKRIDRPVNLVIVSNQDVDRRCAFRIRRRSVLLNNTDNAIGFGDFVVADRSHRILAGTHKGFPS